MMHQHSAHALTTPRPGDLPGWTGEPVPAPSPRTAVHRGILHPATPAPTQPSPLRFSFATAIALALICAGLGAALATLAAMPSGEVTRVAARAAQ